MKSFDLVLVTGNKASDKQIFQMLSGKNVIGKNIKCTTQIEQQLIKPMHFELLINKSGRITIIPLTPGMQIMQKNKKLKELDINQCYDLEIMQSFYIERTYACYLEEAITKKNPVQPIKQGKQSIWSLKNHEKQDDDDKNKKKLKKEVMDINNQILSESTQSKSDQIDDKADEDYDGEDEQEEITKNEKKRRKVPSNSSKNSVVKKIKSPNSCETTTIMQNINEKKIEEEEQKINTKQNNKHKQNKQVRVILSNCNLTTNEKNKMIKLGATFVENQDEDFDVVVMEEFRRRAKLLIGLNKKAWILSKGWILDCIDDNELIEDYCEYIIEVPQEDQEKYDNLNLDSVQYSIQKGKGFKIFQNSQFFLQEQYKNILVDELQSIIKSGGGKIINSLNQSASSDKQKQIAVIDDPKKIKNPLKNTLYVDPEYILLSSLKQQIQTKYIYNI
ncbi:hypothetical protein ABPG72_015909 [Tetrahymena utriculariae]